MDHPSLIAAPEWLKRHYFFWRETASRHIRGQAGSAPWRSTAVNTLSVRGFESGTVGTLSFADVPASIDASAYIKGITALLKLDPLFRTEADDSGRLSVWFASEAHGPTGRGQVRASQTAQTADQAPASAAPSVAPAAAGASPATDAPEITVKPPFIPPTGWLEAAPSFLNSCEPWFKSHYEALASQGLKNLLAQAHSPSFRGYGISGWLAAAARNAVAGMPETYHMEPLPGDISEARFSQMMMDAFEKDKRFKVVQDGPKVKLWCGAKKWGPTPTTVGKTAPAPPPVSAAAAAHPAVPALAPTAAVPAKPTVSTAGPAPGLPIMPGWNPAHEPEWLRLAASKWRVKALASIDATGQWDSSELDANAKSREASLTFPDRAWTAKKFYGHVLRLILAEGGLQSVMIPGKPTLVLPLPDLQAGSGSAAVDAARPTIVQSPAAVSAAADAAGLAAGGPAWLEPELKRWLKEARWFVSSKGMWLPFAMWNHAFKLQEAGTLPAGCANKDAYIKAVWAALCKSPELITKKNVEGGSRMLCLVARAAADGPATGHAAAAAAGGVAAPRVAPITAPKFPTLSSSSAAKPSRNVLDELLGTGAAHAAATSRSGSVTSATAGAGGFEVRRPSATASTKGPHASMGPNPEDFDGPGDGGVEHEAQLHGQGASAGASRHVGRRPSSDDAVNALLTAPEQAGSGTAAGSTAGLTGQLDHGSGQLESSGGHADLDHYDGGSSVFDGDEDKEEDEDEERDGRLGYDKPSTVPAISGRPLQPSPFIDPDSLFDAPLDAPLRIQAHTTSLPHRGGDVQATQGAAAPAAVSAPSFALPGIEPPMFAPGCPITVAGPLASLTRPDIRAVPLGTVQVPHDNRAGSTVGTTTNTAYLNLSHATTVVEIGGGGEVLGRALVAYLAAAHQSSSGTTSLGTSSDGAVPSRALVLYTGSHASHAPQWWAEVQKMLPMAPAAGDTATAGAGGSAGIPHYETGELMVGPPAVTPGPDTPVEAASQQDGAPEVPATKAGQQPLVTVFASGQYYAQRAAAYGNRVPVLPLHMPWSSMTVPLLLRLLGLEHDAPTEYRNDEEGRARRVLDGALRGILGEYHELGNVSATALQDFYTQLRFALQADGDRDGATDVTNKLLREVGMALGMVQADRAVTDTAVPTGSTPLLAALSRPGIVVVDLTDFMLSRAHRDNIMTAVLDLCRGLDARDNNTARLLAVDALDAIVAPADAATLPLMSVLADVARGAARSRPRDNVRTIVTCDDPSVLGQALLDHTSLLLMRRFHSRRWFKQLQEALPLADSAWPTVLGLGHGDVLAWSTRVHVGPGVDSRTASKIKEEHQQAGVMVVHQ